MKNINWKALVVPVLILFVFIGGIIGIVNWQKSKQATPTVSELSINLPEGESQTTEKEISVSGKVKKGDKVTVNEAEVKVEKDGSYAKVVTLSEGSNKIIVKDTKNGKEVGSTERTVKYVAAAAPKPQDAQPTPAQQGSAPAAVAPQASGELATSGPKETAAVVGFGVLVLIGLLYLKSKKQLHLNLRK
ncbi:MAG: hypothetical protein AAB632_02845 [Patescibacteria group bacterium]